MSIAVRKLHNKVFFFLQNLIYVAYSEGSVQGCAISLCSKIEYSRNLIWQPKEAIVLHYCVYVQYVTVCYATQ